MTPKFTPHLACWPFRLPQEAQALLDDKTVLAYGLVAHIPATGSPSWDLGVSICLPRAPTVWISNWAMMRNLGIPGLGDALAAIQQDAVFLPPDLAMLWGAHRRVIFGSARV